MNSTDAFDPRITTYGRLRDAHHRLDAAFSPTYERHGLSATWFEALLRVRRSPEEQLRMCDLADQIALTTGGATRLVDGLIRGGFVDRVADPDDRRVQLVVLTVAGRHKLDETVASHLDDLDAELFARLSQRDVAQLNRLLDRLREPAPPTTTTTSRAGVDPRRSKPDDQTRTPA